MITIPGNPAPPLETRGPTDAASMVVAVFAFLVDAAGNTRRCVGETAPPDGGSGGGGEVPSRAGFPGFAIVSKETVGLGSATAGVAVFAFFVDAAGNTRRCVGETAPPDGGSGGSGGDLDTIVVDGEKREPETGNQLGAPPPQLGGVARPQPTGALWRRRRHSAVALASDSFCAWLVLRERITAAQSSPPSSITRQWLVASGRPGMAMATLRA